MAFNETVNYDFEWQTISLIRELHMIKIRIVRVVRNIAHSDMYMPISKDKRKQFFMRGLSNCHS
jgi:hypothetical protein